MNDNVPTQGSELRAAYFDLITGAFVAATFVHQESLGLGKRPQTPSRPSATVHHLPPLLLHP